MGQSIHHLSSQGGFLGGGTCCRGQEGSEVWAASAGWAGAVPEGAQEHPSVAWAAHGKGISAQGMPLLAHMLPVAQVPLGPGCGARSRKSNMHTGREMLGRAGAAPNSPMPRHTAVGDPRATSPACPSVPPRGSAQLQGAELVSSHSLLGAGAKKSLNR